MYCVCYKFCVSIHIYCLYTHVIKDSKRKPRAHSTAEVGLCEVRYQLLGQQMNDIYPTSVLLDLTWLYYTILHSTIALLHSTWLYLTQLDSSWLFLTWLDSTWLYNCSTWLDLTILFSGISSKGSIFKQSWSKEEVSLYLESNGIKAGMHAYSLPHSQTWKQSFKPENEAKSYLTHALLGLVPRPFRLQFLMTCSMEKRRGKAWAI